MAVNREESDVTNGVEGSSEEAAIAAVRKWDAEHWCAACRDLACERCTDSAAESCGHACDAARRIRDLEAEVVTLAKSIIDLTQESA